MNKQLTEHYNMWVVLESMVNENSGIWSGNPPFAASFTLFVNQVNIFEQLLASSSQSSTGVSADKQAAKEACVVQSDWLAARIRSYAGQSNNSALYKQADVSVSSLSHLREGILANYAQTLHDEADDLITDLNSYGVTTQILTNYQTAITHYRDLMGKPRGIIGEAAEALEQMAEQDKALMHTLALRLDNDVKFFELTHPAFYGQYLNARQIVDLPTHRRALDILVKDSQTGQPIADVALRVMPTDIRRHSSQTGRAQVQNLVQGNYTLEASLPGYQPLVHPLIIISGQTTTTELLLVPLA